MQAEKDFELIEAPEKYKSNREYFACEIKGESMNRIIPNGPICIFKKHFEDSRNGMIVLVENLDIQDPDFNSAFTVKPYTSDKQITEEDWEHKSITLRPNSYDETYENIIIDEDNGSNMKIRGIFITTIDKPQENADYE